VETCHPFSIVRPWPKPCQAALADCDKAPELDPADDRARKNRGKLPEKR